MNTASNKLSSSLDRQAGAGKPVDPATRLSELLAQSLEELTRPFDPPRPGPVPLHPEHMRAQPAEEPGSEHTPEETRIDADKALAELEAELFAAAQQVSRDLPEAPQAANEDIEDLGETEEHSDEHLEDQPEEHAEEHADELDVEHPAVQEHLELPPAEQLDDTPAFEQPLIHEKAPAKIEAAPEIVPSPFLHPEAEATFDAKPDDADASAVIAKVRKLMLVSMAVTIVAVGSVFGFIGYRMFKGEGTAAKTADKLPEAPAIPTDITLSLPHGARVIQSAVSGDRLVITLEIDGKIEVRTFDVNSLQPAGRLNFSGTP
jgi:hypothetical protein